MVMKTYFKSIFRSFKHNLSRFISITLIVFVGVCFVSGIGTLSKILTSSISEKFLSHNVYDIDLKSKRMTGFTLEEIENLKKESYIKSIEPLFIYDDKDNNSRFIIRDFKAQEINKLTLKEGNLISKEGEILSSSSEDINKEITFQGYIFQVVGVIDDPSIYSSEKEYNNYEEKIDVYYYIDSSYFKFSKMLPFTDIYIVCNKDVDTIFSQKYRDIIDSSKEELLKNYNDIALLTYEESVSYNLVDKYREKIEVIAILLPVFFILVSSLVVLTTMTRLIEEERNIIGCYRTLGYSSFLILNKYIVFSLVCCFLGSICGIICGIYLVPVVIYPAFDALFVMPKVMTSSRSILVGIIALIATVISVLLVTIYTCTKTLKEKPSDLLRGKAPKPGRKILLEKIPFIWNPIKFRYKSSLRNVFRYVKHLIMTVVSISGSTALVLAGFGLNNLVMNPDEERIPSSMGESFRSISFLVIIFAALLTILVIYNLTNMNIGERNKEIATLKVLGYQNIEVGFYIYREVTLMGIIGIIFGLPLGYGFIDICFSYLDMGSVSSVKPSSYIITSLLVLLFILIVDIILFPKIKKVDMNESLKSNE